MTEFGEDDDAMNCLACAAATAALNVNAPDSLRLSQAWLLGCAEGIRSVLTVSPIPLCEEHAPDLKRIVEAMAEALRAIRGDPDPEPVS
jgi:hypothetical protein